MALGMGTGPSLLPAPASLGLVGLGLDQPVAREQSWAASQRNPQMIGLVCAAGTFFGFSTQDGWWIAGG